MVCFFRNTFHLKGYLVCNIQKMWLKIALVNIGHGSVLCFDASKKVQSFLELIEGQIVIMSNTMRWLTKGIYVPYYPL